MMTNLLLSLDYGKTLGYTVFDLDTRTVVLMGSAEDKELVISIFVTLAPNLSYFIYEHIADVKDVYSTDLVSAFKSYLADTNKTCIIHSVSPATWKNSSVRLAKPDISKHAYDSYRIGLYFIKYGLS